MNDYYSYAFNIGNAHFYMDAILKEDEIESYKDLTFPWLSKKSLEIYEQTFKYMFADEYSMYDNDFAKATKDDEGLSNVNYAFYNKSGFSSLSSNDWNSSDNYYYMTDYSTNSRYTLNSSALKRSLDDDSYYCGSDIDNRTNRVKELEKLLVTDENVARLFKASLNRYIHLREQERFEKIQSGCASVKKIEKMGKDYKVNFDDVSAN